MHKIKVNLTTAEGELLDSFYVTANENEWHHAVYPLAMIAQTVKECIEDSFETEDIGN